MKIDSGPSIRWVVIDDQDHALMYTQWQTKTGAVQEFMVWNRDKTWRTWKRHGYRCVKVAIYIIGM